MLSSLKALSKGLSTVGAYISSTLLVLLVVLIMTEIIGRSFFDYSTMIADEYSGYLYLAAVFLVWRILLRKVVISELIW